MTNETSIREEWDFYPTQVEDAPASMFLNLGFVDALPPHHLPVLHWVALEILQPGEHGMGVQPDVDSLYVCEDAIVPALAALGLVFVARLRNAGEWRLHLYGRAVDEARMLAALERAMDGQARGFRFGSEEDPEGECYSDFLYPPPERLQWIMDRRLVTQLQQHGDVLTAERPVDHFINFPESADVTAFRAAARELGFEMPDEVPAAVNGMLSLQVQRMDTVELEPIHEVVMQLVDLAARYDGAHDGWGCPLVKQEDVT